MTSKEKGLITHAVALKILLTFHHPTNLSLFSSPFLCNIAMPYNQVFFFFLQQLKLKQNYLRFEIIISFQKFL
uniref:Uncharacterized protein n=1 Tax=Octopus bimaculoides TaxID=37653 RepID=A0A0L8I278_OCTBM